MDSISRQLLMNGGAGNGGDPHYASVALLLHGDGADGSTTFMDSSPTPKTVTAYGNAQISTAQSRFGGASMKFDGAGDYTSCAASASINLTTGDWTIEGWIYVTALTAASQSVCDKDGVYGVSYPQYSIAVSSAGKLVAFLGNGNGITPTGTTFTGGATITQNAWHHVAMVRTGGTCLGYLDGAQEWTGTVPAMYEGGKPLLIGYHQGQPAGTYFNGHIDDLRITKGVARYTSAFTPPTAPFPNY